MRGYTTLLGHILGSHPQITGYCEMHMHLRNHHDLHHLAHQVARRSRKGFHDRYVFDNLLHDHLMVGRKVLRRSDLHPLFMIREPQATIESILSLQARYIRRVAEAERYYLQRLGRLKGMIELCGGDLLFLQAEALVECTDATLQRLSSWLQLDSPLSADYQRFQHTGKRRVGDSSANIHAGRVLSPAERITSRQFTVDAGEIKRAREGHQAFMEWVSVELPADKTVFA